MSIEVTVQCRAIKKNGKRCERMTSQTSMCPQHLRRRLGLEVKESTIPHAGLGLFTTKDRKKGENICTYSGKIILEMSDSDSETEREPYIGRYVLQVQNNILIDAARTDSEGRYINSARGTRKKNNVQAVWDRKKKIANIRARQKIKAGEELLMGYGSAYWRYYSRIAEN